MYKRRNCLAPSWCWVSTSIRRPSKQNKKKGVLHCQTYACRESIKSDIQSSFLTSWRLHQKAKRPKQLDLSCCTLNDFPSKHLPFLPFHILPHMQAGMVLQIFLSCLLMPLEFQQNNSSLIVSGITLEILERSKKRDNNKTIVLCIAQFHHLLTYNMKGKHYLSVVMARGSLLWLG